MSAFSRWLLLTVAVLLTGFALFLVTWDIPQPTERIERVIPDETLPR
ncbi:MAG: hypothetical protein ACOCYE_06755 [Pseudomonadota bacterium]